MGRESTGGAKVRVYGESSGDVGAGQEKRECIFITAGEVGAIASAMALTSRRWLFIFITIFWYIEADQ